MLSTDHIAFDEVVLLILKINRDECILLSRESPASSPTHTQMKTRKVLQNKKIYLKVFRECTVCSLEPLTPKQVTYLTERAVKYSEQLYTLTGRLCRISFHSPNVIKSPNAENLYRKTERHVCTQSHLTQYYIFDYDFAFN